MPLSCFFSRVQVAELSQQLDMESKKSMQLEAQNRDLREELSTLHENCEKLEKSKCQLKEEVAKLQHRLETNMVDHSQIEQYKREVDERAGQEIRQKLQEVNLFLQVSDLLTCVCRHSVDISCGHHFLVFCFGCPILCVSTVLVSVLKGSGRMPYGWAGVPLWCVMCRQVPESKDCPR